MPCSRAAPARGPSTHQPAKRQNPLLRPTDKSSRPTTAPASSTATPEPPPIATSEPIPTATTEPAPTATSEPTPRDPALGDRVQVGSLDLTVLGIERIDTTQFNSFNDQNLRIHVLATNARGAEDTEYDLPAIWAFRLVDANGVVHDAGLACVGCPSVIADASLPLGRSVLGYVYFELLPERDPVELIYEPLISRNRARIDLTRTGNDAGTSPPTLTPERLAGQPGTGEVVEVGSLDLTVLEHGPVETDHYSRFNTANYAVRIQAVNARGDADEEYTVSAFLGFALVDTNGVRRNPDLFCADCPEAIDNVDLVRGGRVEGLVYFELPDDVHIVELRYAPLWSRNVARIWLR